MLADSRSRLKAGENIYFLRSLDDNLGNFKVPPVPWASHKIQRIKGTFRHYISQDLYTKHASPKLKLFQETLSIKQVFIIVWMGIKVP